MTKNTLILLADSQNIYTFAVTPAIPLYMGLMAIAGAYLLKGNLPKKDK